MKIQNTWAIAAVCLFAGASSIKAQSNPSSSGGSTPKGQIVALLNALDKLYAPPPPGLGHDAAQTLVVQREKAKQNLIQSLAALGPGAAQAISDLYKQSSAVRDRLILAEALGSSQDPAALPVLQSLLGGETDYFDRQKLISALAHRPESAAGDTLAGVLSGSDPGGLKFAAVQGLAGRPGALTTLDTIIEGGTDVAVRLEAIRSLGRIGTDTARLTLVGIAQKTALDVLVRQTAIQELRRSFGSAAVQVLTALTQDPNPAVGNAASQTLTMLNKP